MLVPMVISGKPLPESIGPYKVIKQLGKGGMGVVYEVRDTRKPGPSLALKVIHSDDPLALKRFGRERPEHVLTIEQIAREIERKKETKRQRRAANQEDEVPF